MTISELFTLLNDKIGDCFSWLWHLRLIDIAVTVFLLVAFGSLLAFFNYVEKKVKEKWGKEDLHI